MSDRILFDLSAREKTPERGSFSIAKIGMPEQKKTNPQELVTTKIPRRFTTSLLLLLRFFLFLVSMSFNWFLCFCSSYSCLRMLPDGCLWYRGYSPASAFPRRIARVREYRTRALLRLAHIRSPVSYGRYTNPTPACCQCRQNDSPPGMLYATAIAYSWRLYLSLFLNISRKPKPSFCHGTHNNIWCSKVGIYSYGQNSHYYAPSNDW